MGTETRDPVGEAWRWLESQLDGQPLPPVLVLIGLGDGYLLDALEARRSHARVLALEPDPGSAARFLARRRWDDWRREGRLIYLTDPDYAGAADAWRMLANPAAAFRVLVHPALPPDERVARAARALKSILFAAEANAEARRRLAPLYLVNVIRNSPAIAAGADVRALTRAYEGLPAIIAAAGPSLDAAISGLRDAGHRALLIAADTALRPLLAAGIAPPLVVGLDPGAANLRHFLALPECRQTWLVAETALDPNAAAVFDRRTFWFRAAAHHPWPWLNEAGIDVGHLDVWGSVLTGAFQVACLAGCNPIVLVGADLSYTGGRPYARGTTYEFDWAWSAACGADLASSWAAQIARADPQVTRDLACAETTTTASLLSFRDWMLARARRCGRQVINASGAGILFGDGVAQMTLSAALAGRPAISSVPSPRVVGRGRSDARGAALAQRLRQVRDALARGDLASPPLAEWSEFSGGGFDGAQVGAALDDAVCRLEPGRRRESIACPPVRASRISHALTPELPECIERFRAALNGVDPLPETGAAPAGDRVALLEEALRILHGLCDEVLRAGDVEPLRPTQGAARVPASALYAWPETLRWSILGFEALLGRAWTAAVQRPPDSSCPPLLRLHEPDDPDAGETTSPALSHACALLIDRWLRCAGGLDGRESARLRDLYLASPLAPRFLSVRVLSAEGLGRSTVTYATTRGAVCVPLHGRESVLVTPGGRLEPHQAWPRPIVFELPLGEGGAVAWGNGMSRWPEAVEPAYVMYRMRAGGEVVVEELPVRPTFGTWWNGRLYWNCYPSPLDSWTGVASWAPNGGLKREIPQLLLHGMHPAAGGLRLEPCVFHPGRGYERRRLAEGWVWRPGHPLESVALDPRGAMSCRDTRDGWTAAAYPESDRVRVDGGGRSASIECPFPLKLAWTGGSLLVSTADRDVLLLENLMDIVAHRRSRS